MQTLKPIFDFSDIFYQIFNFTRKPAVYMGGLKLDEGKLMLTHEFVTDSFFKRENFGKLNQNYSKVLALIALILSTLHV